MGGLSQVEPDSLLTSHTLTTTFFAASLEETAASHKKLFTDHMRSANAPLPRECSPRPSGSTCPVRTASKLPSWLPSRPPHCTSLLNSWGRRVVGRGAKQSGYLQAAGKRGQVVIKEERFITSRAAERRRQAPPSRPPPPSHPNQL